MPLKIERIGKAIQITYVTVNDYSTCAIPWAMYQDIIRWALFFKDKQDALRAMGVDLEDGEEINVP